MTRYQSIYIWEVEQAPISPMVRIFLKVLFLNVSNALTFSIVMMELIQYSNIRLGAGSSAIRLPSI